MSWAAPLYRIYEHRLAASLDRGRLPRHVGAILDGHRRFARAEGHDEYTQSYRAGMAKLLEMIRWSRDLDIPVVTAWVLSTENLGRPAHELEPYFDVLVDLLEQIPSFASEVGFDFHVIGSLDLLPTRLALAAKAAEHDEGSRPMTVDLAIAYGGRQEIVDACRSLVVDLAASGHSADEIAERIDAEGIAGHLYTGDLPDPDLVVRTSGESRLSGFLLWQAAYAECAFVDPYWPAFRRVDFLRALRDYSRSERRFGR